MGRTYLKKKKQHRKRTLKKSARTRGNMRGGVIFAVDGHSNVPATYENIQWFIENSHIDLVANYSLRSSVFKFTLKKSKTPSNLYDVDGKNIRELVVKVAFYSSSRVGLTINEVFKVAELPTTNSSEFNNQQKIDELFTNIKIVPQVAVYIDNQVNVNTLLQSIVNSNVIFEDDKKVIDDINKITQSQSQKVEVSMMIMEYIPEEYIDLRRFRHLANAQGKLPIYESICQFIVACIIIIIERLGICNIDVHTGNILIHSDLIKEKLPLTADRLVGKVKIIDWGEVIKTPIYQKLIEQEKNNNYIFNIIRKMLFESLTHKGYSQMTWLSGLLFKITDTPILGILTTGDVTTPLFSEGAKMEAKLQKLQNEIDDIEVELINIDDDSSDSETKKYKEDDDSSDSETKKYKEDLINKYNILHKKMNDLRETLKRFEYESINSVYINLEDPNFIKDPIVSGLNKFCDGVTYYKKAIEEKIDSPPLQKRPPQINQENNPRKKKLRI
jgi:hypothetical protein